MPVLLVRHAVAMARRSWAGDDADRPLDDRGRRQADALVAPLAPFRVVRFASSPAVRCLDTVAPAAAARQLDVAPDDALFEGAYEEAIALVEALLADADVGSDAGPAAVLCSHGDVIPEVLNHLAGGGARLDDSRCQKASTWVLARQAGGVAGHYLPPPA